MSLKDILSKSVREKGYMSYGEICQIAAEEGSKVETATRRLRELESIEPVMAKSKRNTEYIKGYKYIFGQIPSVQSFLYKVHQPVTNFRDPNA